MQISGIFSKIKIAVQTGGLFSATYMSVIIIILKYPRKKKTPEFGCFCLLNRLLFF